MNIYVLLRIDDSKWDKELPYGVILYKLVRAQDLLKWVPYHEGIDFQYGKSFHLIKNT